jgi:hypothetical protein
VVVVVLLLLLTRMLMVTRASQDIRSFLTPHSTHDT